MARPASPRARALLTALLASTALVGIGLMPVRAEPLPTGGQVVSGGVTIGSPSQGALAITQSSQNAIVNWQGFSVGRTNRVDIHQPNANAAILNRVTGATPSTIAGQINANGQVYLVNPNGISITGTGRVNAAGFVASSLGISDEDFRAGRRQFRGSGASAPVSNHGAITLGRGGYAALIGGQVTNTGTIAVPMGRVGLGSGERATLDLSGDGFLQVAVPTGAKGRGALVEHSGTISAEGGSVQISAAAARDMARQAVNLSGVVEARSASGKNGRITLSGDEGAVRVAPGARLDASGPSGADGGRVRITGGRLDVAGTVDVSGAKGGRARLKASETLALSGRVLAEGRAGRGGRVVATAPTITTHAALIDVSGATGGGTVRVGGGRLGRGPLARAEQLTVDAASTIRADATAKGEGGDVVVWSDAATRFAGTLTARGGAQGGDGGQAEVSSKGVLAYDGTTILTAAQGRFGTLLLDPHEITIANAADRGVTGFTATGDGSVIDATRLLTALTTANVVVSTGTTGNQSGTITVAAPLSWNTGADLTLQAAGGIALNAPIAARAGGLVLQAGAGNAVTATADLSVARFTLASGNWTQNAVTLPGFATADFRIADGASFLRAVGGAGTTASPYLLTDIYGVQGMGSSAAYRAAAYRLATDIDATDTATWRGGQGFVPVGTNTARFTGSLEGAGHTIAGLTIARPGQNLVGLIGFLGADGRVSGLGLVGGSVTGSYAVGGLVGYIYRGTVSQSYASVSVTGSSTSVGGLVGVNSGGTVSQSYASGSVTGSSDFVGGLVGSNSSTGTVSQSYASVSVTGSKNFVGGLVGYNDGKVSESYASGSVTGSSTSGSVTGIFTRVGGLVGSNSSTGTVSQSYASGSVTGSDFVGGLVGDNDGTLQKTYWDAQTTGQSRGVGLGLDTGTTGLTPTAARTASSYGGFDFTSSTPVWYQAGDMRPILRSEAAAPVGGVIAVSNLHQLQLMGANLAGSYRLTRDLDASETNQIANTASVFGPGGFVPVGTTADRFTGSLDGAGHTIAGLTVARPGQTSVGLIGFLGTGGSVSGLGLVGGSVTGYAYVGGLVGDNSGTVSQSYASGSVSGRLDVGGLVGSNYGTVSQSYASGSVTGYAYVGGLVGYNSGGTVGQSYASGSVTASDSVGGLVGDNSGKVSQSYASGSVAGSSSVGGLVGYNYSRGTVSQSYASGSVTSVSSSSGGLVGTHNGTLTNTYWDTQTTGRVNGVGAGSDTGATGLTTAQARSQIGYINPLDTTQSFDFGTVWYQAGDLRPILRSEAAAAGADGVIPVSNLHQLQLMGANLAGSYRLTRDLDASATSATDAASGPWGAGGFVPVGKSGSGSNFTGSLDGAGHTVSGLTIIRPNQNEVGLIGYLGLGGSVSRLGLVGGSITGSTYVGGLVGFSLGTVNRSYASGSVIGGSSGSQSVGGLIGSNHGGTVSQSYASGSVTSGSGSQSVGGLVGENSGTVRQSYASGRIAGANYVGGLVGYSSGTVSQSYASGSVSGNNWLGGLVGINDVGTVSQSYASGSVSGAAGVNAVGGLVGFNIGTLTYTYWDTESAGQSRGVGFGSSTGATGWTTAQMQDLSSFRTTYAGYDFATVWAPPNQAGQGGQSAAYYPQLYGLSNVVAVTPTSANRVYGEANPVVSVASTTYTGLRAGNFVTSLGSLHTGATATSDVGSHTVTVSGTAVTSTTGDAYRIVLVPGALSVTPATITVAGATGVNKTYDRSAALPGGGTGFTSSGVLFGDDVTVSAGSAAYDSARAGNRSVLVSGLTLGGAKAGNYVLSSASVTGSGRIDRANLAVSGVSAASKTYDGTTAATLSGTATVFALTGDVVSVHGTGTGSFADKNAGTNKPVTLTGYTLTGTDAGNYILVQPGGLSADIARANLAVSGISAASKTYDGTTGATLTGSATVSPIGSDVVSVGGTGIGSFADKNVGTNKPVTLTGYTLSGTDAGNYALVRPTGLSADITRASLAVSGISANGKTYDGTTAATLSGTATITALTGDVISVDGTGIGSFADKNAGRNKPVTVTGYTLSGTDAGNYALVLPALSADIARATLTYTADAVRRPYGAANPALTGTVTGFVPGESLASAATGTLAFGTPATASSNVDTYAITGSGLSAGNYVFVQAAGNAGALTVDPAALSLSGARTYDATTGFTADQITVAGGVNGETLTLTSGSGTAASADAGTYAGSSLTGLRLAVTGGNGSAANYRLPATGTLSITPAPVIATALSGSSTYGDTPANPGLSATGLVGGEGVGVLTGLSSDFGLDAASAAGSYTLTVTGSLTNRNYRIDRIEPGTFTVDPRALTVTADTLTRSYGDANPALTFTVGGRGLVNGDRLAGELATSAAVTSGIGDYAITQGSLAASANYRLTYQGADLTVTPRPVILSGTRVYDAGIGIDGGLLTVANRRDGDSVTLTGIGTLGGRNVGAQAITDVAGLTLSNANYTLIGAGGAVTITPATLTYTADAVSRTYGGANPAVTGTVTGFLGSDALATATTGTLTFATDAGTGSNVGRYAVTGAGLAAGNYVLVQGAGNATALTVDPALLTLTGTKTYDATTGFRAGQLAVSGGVNGETVTLTAGSGSTASADAGIDAGAILTDLRLSVSGGNGSAANYRLPTTGTLAITPATVDVRVNDGRSVYGERPVDPGFSATGLVGGQDANVLIGLSTGFGLDAASAAGYYTLAPTGRLANGNYRIGSATAGTYIVDRRPITVTADALGRVYGDADPTLTYTIGGHGLANGDRLTGALATAAGRRSDVGGYAIGQGTLAASANYDLSYQGADLTITARPITVFADPQTRRVGAADPLLTYTVGGRGLVAGDRLSGGLATTAEAESEPGLYRITRGSLTASANYSLGFVGADLAVLPAATQPVPQPEPRLVALDASRLASTAERAARLDGRPAAPDLPLLLGTGPGGSLVVADPRFDAILVCAGHQGGCFLASPADIVPDASRRR